jgi:hypothetical protein
MCLKVNIWAYIKTNSGLGSKTKIQFKGLISSKKSYILSKLVSFGTA